MIDKKILVINCGSSSIKYEVYSMPEKLTLGKGVVERIGIAGSRIIQTSNKGEYRIEADMPDHKIAMSYVLKAITNLEKGFLLAIDEIKGVGHRVVHGGEKYAASVIIDQGVIDAIREYSDLAPLHNPVNLIGIEATMEVLGGIPQIAVFDTAFHQTLQPHAYLYGIPRAFYDQYKIRRYGFHGTSHRYVANMALNMLKRAPENTNLVTCHLGNGASITAIENGLSIDTSMGFTPLEGLMMGTRSGDIDPAIIGFLVNKGIPIQEVMDILNKKSGLLGLSGVSSDLRDLENEYEKGNRNVIETLDSFAHRVRKYIGAYCADLVKVDVLVFTGGIGQHGHKMRQRICQKLENLGIVMDYGKNRHVGSNAGIVSRRYSPTTIVIIPTNEELQIALDTFNLIEGIEQNGL